MSLVPVASFIIATTGHAIKPCQTIVWWFDNGGRARSWLPNEKERRREKEKNGSRLGRDKRRERADTDERYPDDDRRDHRRDKVEQPGEDVR